MLYIGLNRESIKIFLSETKMARILLFGTKDYLLDLASTQFLQSIPLGQNGPNPEGHMALSA